MTFKILPSKIFSIIVSIVVFITGACKAQSSDTKSSTTSIVTDGASIYYDWDKKVVLDIRCYKDFEHQAQTFDGGEYGGNVKTELLGLSATNSIIKVSGDMIDVAFKPNTDPVFRFITVNNKDRAQTNYDVHFNKGPKPGHLYIQVKSNAGITKQSFTYQDIVAICKTSNQRIRNLLY